MNYSGARKYPLAMRIMHWLTAFIIIALLSTGVCMVNMPLEDKRTFYDYHKSLGVISIVFVVWRIIVRWQSIVPEFRTYNILEYLLEKAVHFLMCVLPAVIALSGLFMALYSGKDFSFFSQFEVKALVAPDIELSKLLHKIHTTVPYLLLCCLVCHLLAIVYHKIFYGKNLLKRIW